MYFIFLIRYLNLQKLRYIVLSSAQRKLSDDTPYEYFIRWTQLSPLIIHISGVSTVIYI